MTAEPYYKPGDFGLIEIYCDHKSHPYYIIAKMQKSPHGGKHLAGKWDQVEPMSNEFRGRLNAYYRALGEASLENPKSWDTSDPTEDWIEADKGWSYTYIKDGKPIPLDQAKLNDPTVYKKYEFRCPRCHTGRAPIERREEKLAPVLEALQTANIEKVSWQTLARWISYYDRTRK